MPDLRASEGAPVSGDPKFEDFAKLVHQASDLHRKQQDGQAIAVAKSAAATANNLSMPETSDAVDTLNSLGLILFETGYTRIALNLYERAVGLSERLITEPRRLTASLNNNLGQAYGRLNRWEQAQSCLETAVSIDRQLVPGSVSLGIVLDNLGCVHTKRGNLAAAETAHKEACQIFEELQTPFSADLATSIGNLAKVFATRQDRIRAEAYMLRALDAHQRTYGPMHPETLLDTANLAYFYQHAGDEDSADRLTSYLLWLGSNNPEPIHRHLAGTLQDMARGALADARLDLAERLATRAAELIEGIEGRDAPDTLAANHLLADVHYEAGSWDMAEAEYHRAQSGYEGLHMQDEATDVVIQLSKVYRQKHSYVLAEQLLQSAIDKLRSAPQQDHQRIAGALGNLALTYYESERYSEAESAFDVALQEVSKDTTTRFGETPWLSYSHGILKYHLGRYDEALALLGNAERLWVEERGADHPFVATATSHLALVLWAIGDIDRAADYFAETEAALDRQLRRTLAIGNEQQRLRYAWKLQAHLDEVISFCFQCTSKERLIARLAAETLVRQKGRVLDGIAHSVKQIRINLDREGEAIFDRLQAVRAEIGALIGTVLTDQPVIGSRTEEQRGRPVLLSATVEAHSQLAKLHSEEESLEATLSYRGALFNPGLGRVSLQQVQQNVPTDGALIELLEHTVFDSRGATKGTRYVAMVLRSAGDPQWFDLGDASVIASKVEHWRGLLSSLASDEGTRNSVGSELYKLLVAPVEDAIVGARQLLISPDGELSLLPFGVLPDLNGEPLLKSRIVSYLTSARELIPSPALSDAHGIVVFAAPDFDVLAEAGSPAIAQPAASRAPFKALEQTRHEANVIRQLFDDDVVLHLGQCATTEALRAVRRPAVLHIATHGVFSPMEADYLMTQSHFLPMKGRIAVIESASRVTLANPMYFSALAFAGANRQSLKGRTGIMTAQEIAGLDLQGTELVVLSACETGLGTAKHGREFSGLRRALALAGAATQVTSLWRVDDTATRALMRHYYRLLLAGCARAEALQTAQERIAADSGHPDWEHPAFWAAFISAGAYAPLQRGLKRHGEAGGPSI